MQRWMQQFLSSNNRAHKSPDQREETMYFQRRDLTSLKGMDVAGQADALGLGWVYMTPNNTLPGIMQKNRRRRWLYYLYNRDSRGKHWCFLS